MKFRIAAAGVKFCVDTAMKGEPSRFYLVGLLLEFDIRSDGTEAVTHVRMLCGVSNISDFSRRF